MKSTEHEFVLWICVGYSLWTISALECEKYD